MKVLGIDIGTTSICAIVLQGANGEVLETVSINNDAALKNLEKWEALQDADLIWQSVERLIDELTKKHPDIGGIGLTGQMHGIVYTDSNGQAVSPLYTWQDGRGDLEVPAELLSGFMSDQMMKSHGSSDLQASTKSYAALLSYLSGYKLATGYGAVTHFYNQTNQLVPAEAVKLCTIHDYIGMRLTGRKLPLVHSSDAASIGFFVNGSFDEASLKLCQINPDIFPDVVSDFAVIGKTHNIPVIVAIGDNQASFIGSVRDMAGSIVLNVGTSGQISLLADSEAKDISSMELRPLATITDSAKEWQIAVGAALCGGKAYALLEGFFQSVLDMAGLASVQKKSDGASLFPVMNDLAVRSLAQPIEECSKLIVSTKFNGTRDDPGIRGSINNISAHNFEAQHLVLGVLEGIINELYEYYQPDKSHKLLVGSGNALRRNPVLQQIAVKRFGLPLLIPAHQEEAAYGAALSALAGTGFCDSLEQAQQLIRYQEG